ncbi:hypothetical protein [Flavobacterium sp. LAR06]|uniref:hypothetical protein n=1 Tax=Flavobacterium sp. LAR06 TaxID=3064897 RepID=UPI0035BF0466
METKELENIIKICNKATRPPWNSFIEERDHESGSNFIMTGDENDRDYDIEFFNIRKDDQDFIAMSRNVVPQLVSEIIRLQKILKDSSISF